MRCCSCGEILTNRRRLYCSNECKQLLRRKLWLSEGLIRSLNTWFATFSWNESAITLKILPYQSDEVFCFFHSRAPSTKPAVDLGNMIEILGKKWWNEHNKSRSRYKASQAVLHQANRITGPREFRALQEPRVQLQGVDPGKLDALLLTDYDLLLPGRKELIKKAYWTQAKISHPDSPGGNARMFIHIKKAYESLKAWAEEPKFTLQKQTSLPGCWVYHGNRSQNRWAPPSNHSAKTGSTS